MRSALPLTSPSAHFKSETILLVESCRKTMQTWLMFSLEPNNFNMREQIYGSFRQKPPRHSYRCLRMFIYCLMWRSVLVPLCCWNIFFMLFQCQYFDLWGFLRRFFAERRFGSIWFVIYNFIFRLSPKRFPINGQ